MKNKKIYVETQRGMDVLARKNHFIFGIKIRDFKEISDLIATNKLLQGENSVEKYKLLTIPFKILTEKSYNEIFQEQEKKIAFPHGQAKEKTTDEIVEELNQFFKAE